MLGCSVYFTEMYEIMEHLVTCHTESELKPWFIHRKIFMELTSDRKMKASYKQIQPKEFTPTPSTNPDSLLKKIFANGFI